jgi:heme/copper-type cytochrome/quinol oxidase subunit 4
MESNFRMKSYVGIWIGQICIAGIEVFLTYRDFSVHQLLAILLILAFIEAGIALMYFMPVVEPGSRCAFRPADDESDLARRL